MVRGQGRVAEISRSGENTGAVARALAQELARGANHDRKHRDLTQVRGASSSMGFFNGAASGL